MSDERREGSTDPEQTVEEETVELRRGIPEPDGYPYEGDLDADVARARETQARRRAGTTSPTAPPPATTVEPSRGNQRNTIAIVLGAVLLLLVAGGIVWYLVAGGGSTTQVPAVVGLPAEEAAGRLEADGFGVARSTAPSDAPEGTVFAQDPSAGSEADEGSTVSISVSGGPDTVAVPNAVGLQEAEARDRLVDAGFEVESEEVFSDREPGTVSAQSPNAGAEAALGSAVTIQVSQGTGLVEVPNVVGMTRGQAEAELSNAQLEANVVQVPSDEPVGTVVAQNPVGGQVQQGTTIRLNVSAGR